MPGQIEIFGLLGPNGAGKTTLLRMLAAIIKPDTGACKICGLDSQKHPEEIRAKIGFLSGNTKLYKRMTAREVLKYFGRLNSMPDKEFDQRIDEVIEILDMSEFINRRCETFSTGQMQRYQHSPGNHTRPGSTYPGRADPRPGHNEQPGDYRLHSQRSQARPHCNILDPLYDRSRSSLRPHRTDTQR